MEMRRQARKANPGASKEEIKVIFRARLLEAAREAQKKKRQDEKDSSLSSLLAGTNKEDELIVRGPAQDALLSEFDRSLTREEVSNLFMEVKEANPDATSKELGKALRAAKLKAALVYRRMKMLKRIPLSLFLCHT